MKNIIGTTFIVALILCGCDDGGGGDTSTPPPTAPATATKRPGYLLNVKGVRYKSCGGYEGVTGDRGIFYYAHYTGSNVPDCLVTFSIGGKWQLGYPVFIEGNSAPPDTDVLALTPYELVKYDYDANDDHSPDPNHEVARKNILAMLESLTERPNSRGIIEISTETDQVADAAGWSIPWAAPDFRERAAATLASANKTLIETTQAVNNYAPTVNCRNTGYWTGFGSGGQGTTQTNTDKNGQPVYASVNLEIHGVITPNANAWLYLMDKTHEYNPVTVVDYDVWSGTVAPGRFGLGFDAVGSQSSGSVYFEDGFDMASDNATKIASKDWKPGRFSLTHDKRANRFVDRWTPTNSPHYFELPVLKFAGRNDTYLLALEVYADNTVRVIVNDAKSDTLTGSSDAALLSGSVNGDAVTAEFTGTERSFKAVGSIDRVNMTVTITVTVTTPTQPDPQLYMSITAPGCELSPNLDAT